MALYKNYVNQTKMRLDALIILPTARKSNSLVLCGKTIEVLRQHRMARYKNIKIKQRNEP